MSDSDKNDLISQFAGVTGVDMDRARFFLESSAWKLELALGSFYDDAEPHEEQEQTSSGTVDRSVAGVPAEAAAKPPVKPQSRFATMSNIKDDNANSDSEGEAYYAGGSEHGAGQQILDPRKKKKTADKLVQDMFKAAKEHGAEEVGAEGPSGGRPKPLAFRGTGYRLGETEEQSLAVPGFPAQSQPKQIDMVLQLWKEGFSVDGGPLRGYNEQENQEFLTSVKKGEVPRELIREAKGGEVNLNMEDHRSEEYVAPKVTVKAFSGEGQRLGSPAATLIETPASSVVKKSESSAGAAQAASPVDESKPSTTIQIRLSDGSRLVAKFNHTHTVGDVRNYINSSGSQSANYVLMTTFPNKELTNETQTLQDANLLNAVLVQRKK